MTKQLEDLAREKPTTGKLLVALFSAILVFIVFALGWQQWLYTEQRKEMIEQKRDMKDAMAAQTSIITSQNGIINELKTRQDILRSRQETLSSENAEQDRRIAEKYVTLERYSCDLRDLKDTMREGFGKVTREFDELKRKH